LGCAVINVYGVADVTLVLVLEHVLVLLELAVLLLI
jgi:hypothetical protein